MIIRMSNEFRNNGLAGYTGSLDGAIINVRTGAQPATGETAASGTILATAELPTPAFNAPGAVGTVDALTQTATPGRAYAKAVDQVAVLADGTAGYVEVKFESGTKCFYGDVGLPGSGAFVEIDQESGTLVLVEGTSFALTLGYLQVPAS